MVIAVVAAYVVLSGSGDSEDKPSEGITIVDGSGKTITIKEPIETCTVVNTNIPKAMKVMGLVDNVENYLSYKESNRQSNYEEMIGLGFTKIDKDAPLASNLTNAEYFITKNVKYIIEPVSSNKLTATAEAACENAGIVIIKLDCFGDTMVEDMDKLLKLFGSPKKATTAYNNYLEVRNEVISKVVSKASIKESDLFLFYFNGLKAFYNQTAELSKTFENIWGHNAIGLVVDSPSGVTNKANEEGIKEALVKLDAEKSIDILVIRSSSGDQADKLVSNWNSGPIADYDLSYIHGKDSKVYCIDSDLLSGTIDYIAYVALAEIAGIDTGYSVSDLVDGFYDKYGFKPITDVYIWHYEFDDAGKLSKVVPADIE